MANGGTLKERLMSRGLFDRMPGVRAGPTVRRVGVGICIDCGV